MQKEYQNLINKITQHIAISETDIEEIIHAFTCITVPKNTILEAEEKKTKNLYYINEGFIRLFNIENAEERTTHINCPSGFITNFQSFITSGISTSNLQTISDCKLLSISKDKLDLLNQKVKDWSIFGEKIYEEAVIYNESRTRDMILLSAEERYIKLLKDRPEIIQNVPLQYIASYIGIKPESLSRIRRNIIS